MNFIKKYWSQNVLDLGDRWRTNINKLFIQPGKAPQYSINGKLLRAALKDNVKTIEIAFPERGYVISKSPQELLEGRKETKPSQFKGSEPLDFYFHEVDALFPRAGKKKEIYQYPDQEGLF